MTWSAASEETPCPKCGGPLKEMQARPFPVVTQALFGASFLAFLLLFDKVQPHREWVYAWSAVQVALGVLLVRRRLATRKRILRCIRCGEAVR